MIKLSAWKKVCAIFLLCAATVIACPAQVFKTLAHFDGANGASPAYVVLAQGTDGGLYGTTIRGGANGDYGTIFRIGPKRSLTTIYNFCDQPGCVDGGYLIPGLALASDGNFYGSTDLYGLNQFGTIFKISAKGALTTLFDFQVGGGDQPDGPLLEAGDGNFYGTTQQGGVNNLGIVFMITPDGTLTTLHNFDSTDGALPEAGLVLAADGNFYGTTLFGGRRYQSCGSIGCGTVFRMRPNGTVTTVYRFCGQANCVDGAYASSLMLATDGNLYGTTSLGGAENHGSVFTIDPTGALTTLHSFEGTDGSSPYGVLVQGTDGNFYGVTYEGGHDDSGTVFSMTPAGVLTTLHEFCTSRPCMDGGSPIGGLAQATDGKFYGTTSGNSTLNDGTIFSLDMGLGPFVTFVRPYGKVGQTGGILGQGFTGTTSVSLNGIPANFKVVSDTLVRATVPSGATTGYVTVTTPSGTLTSNVPFHVIK
jgi:uncharacterized repeat protein (TIGR03803 family)